MSAAILQSTNSFLFKMGYTQRGEFSKENTNKYNNV